MSGTILVGILISYNFDNLRPQKNEIAKNIVK